MGKTISRNDSRRFTLIRSYDASMLNRFGFSEFDALTGCKIASIDIGSPAVKMLYSPTSSNAVVAILEVSFLIRSCTEDYF